MLHEGDVSQLSDKNDPPSLNTPLKDGSAAEGERNDAVSIGDKEDSTPVVKFRSRKLPRKARQKRRYIDENADDKDESAVTISDLKLLNAAQELRAKSRASTHAPARKQIQPLHDIAETVTEEDLLGLQSNFAIEKSTHVVEQRMHKYVEERMLQKFGDRTGKESGEGGDNESFDIPDHLKVKERRLYDPGEGLPAAGVEEVEISEEARKRNVAATIKAHKQLMEGKDGAAVGTGGGMFNRGSKEKPESGGDQGEAEAQTTETGMVLKRSRTEIASDTAAFERFRKRWKKSTR